MKPEQIKIIISRHKRELSRKYAVRQIGLFGSVVTGKATKNSDIDILVDFSKPVSLLKLVRLENYLSDLFKLKVDLVPKQDIRTELRERILSQTLYL